jgi:hypothetical protein
MAKALKATFVDVASFFGGVLLVPLPPSILGFAGENISLWACDVNIVCVVFFLQAS